MANTVQVRSASGSADEIGRLAEVDASVLAEGGGGGEAFNGGTITEPLVVNVPVGGFDAFLVEADGVDLLDVQTDGAAKFRLIEVGTSFIVTQIGGGAALNGDVINASSSGVEFKAGDGFQIAYFDREAIGGGLGFFGSNTTQPAAIADATTEADAVTKLNLLLAAMRSLGLIDT